MEHLIGRQFGPYRVVAALGRGGMAVVYKAHQPAVDRYVALKVLSSHFNADPQFLNRFRHEARIVAQLQHPRILQVFDFGESDGYTFLAMPFVTGGTLAAMMKAEPLALDAVVQIVGQICEALDYAHSKGVVHRDIKPSNILIDERRNCIVADFGLARIAAGATQLTLAGAVMGTPAYMSPEQAAGTAVGPASDIYSLGIILYEMLTGRVPFMAETPVAVVMQHVAAPLPSPRRFNPALTPALEGVVLKALARAPQDRFASAHEFQAALVSCAASEPAPIHIAPRWADVPSPGPDAFAGSDAFHSIGSHAFDALAREGADPGDGQSAESRAAVARGARARVAPVTVAVLIGLSAIVGGLWALRNGFGAPRAQSGSLTTPAPLPAREVKLPPAPLVSGEVATTVSRSESTPPPADTRPSEAPPVTRTTPPPAAPIAAADVPATRQAGRLTIETPAGSQVYLDDVFRGAANSQGHLVVEVSTPGDHALRVSLAGKRDFEQQVRTMGGQDVTLRPTFIDAAASLQIRTAAGAEILFDNASRGVAGIDGTMLIPNVAPGRHDVRVLMPGRPAFRQTANVGAGQEMIIEARLDDLDLVQPSSAPITAPRIAGNDRFLLFHFVVGGGWHFGILTVSRNHIEWTETATSGYAVGRIGGFANVQHIEPGSATDNFVATCTEILDVGNNLVASGEHVRLKSRNYDLSPAVKDKDGTLVPKANSPIPGLDKAAADACPGSVK